MKSFDFLIYGLVDPRTGAIRYIGKSTRGLIRPNEHFHFAFKSKAKSHVYSWIRSMGGIRPDVIVLERASSETELNDLEKSEIARLSGLGCRLTNHTDGGDGMLGFKHSVETKKLLRSQMLGTTRPQTSGDNHWMHRTGHPSPMKGRVFPETGKALISITSKGRRYPNRKGQRVLELNSGLEFDQARQAAQHFNVSKSTVSRCVCDGLERQGLRFRSI